MPSLSANALSSRLLAVFPAAALLAFLALPAPAGAQEDPLVGIGEGIWKTQSNCRDCHGGLGNGEPDDPRSPKGMSLRTTSLTQEQIAEVIKCGRPGTPMPYFDKRAYTDTRCYDSTAEDLGDQTPRPGLPSYNDRQIKALAAFIAARFVGKGPVTKEECTAFWGENASSCTGAANDGGH